MNILSIETSCDETALSIISADIKTKNFSVLSDLVISQIDIHKEYGGVFPALAKREHANNLTPLLRHALIEASLLVEGTPEVNTEELKLLLEREPELFEQLSTFLTSTEKPKLDAIMVTYGPGLTPALWVGVNFARALSLVWNIPVIPVNHMEGHITSILFEDGYRTKEKALVDTDVVELPLIALLISGGHTQLVLVKQWGQYEIIGETIDDAVGEAFDKVARMLGMEYPGGPKVSQAATRGVEDDEVTLPRPMIASKDYRFSFSGLKTAVRYLVEDQQRKGTLDEQKIANISREFEHAVAEVLIKKTSDALIEYGAKGLIIAGGVSANTFIVNSFRKVIETEFDGVALYTPKRALCGDNSLMIASAGFIQLLTQENPYVDVQELVAVGNLKLS